MTYDVSGDSITFTLQAQTTGWVGIGFSLDQSMVGHLVTNGCQLSIYVDKVTFPISLLA